MTLTEFDHGYWYATDLKQFASRLGIPSVAKLRKDELERVIKQFLRSGSIVSPTKRKSSESETARVRDVDLGLTLDRRVVRYTNDAATKDFLEEEAKKLDPDYRRRSGARYRLNRWREDQLHKGNAITYRDLVEEYVRLSEPTERFARVPHGRYINFMSDYLAREPRATTAGAISAWHRLKRMDCPKTYRAWVGMRSRKGR